MLLQYTVLLLLSLFLSTTFSASIPEPLSNPSTLESSLDSSLEPRENAVKVVDPKYFHEPGGGDVYGHYDVRYFQGQPVSYEVKQDTLRHLIRSYLTVFRSLNIDTWIAHGTLLGWWWNGKIMPWDWDLDTQVSDSTLLWLGENMNMTFHNHTFASDTPGGPDDVRTYLLDVNPHITERVRGDGMNIIDARWIDTKTGLFIDITGISETEPKKAPGVWSCKNYHRFQTRDIWPLRETVFEGTPALVPHAFEEILQKEYSTFALTKTVHEGYVFSLSSHPVFLPE